MKWQVLFSVAIHDDYGQDRIQPSLTTKFKKCRKAKLPTIDFKSGQITDEMTVCDPLGGGRSVPIVFGPD